jgi:hypothetical protein
LSFAEAQCRGLHDVALSDFGYGVNVGSGSLLEKLSAVGGPALGFSSPDIPAALLELAGPVGAGLISLLQAKNGFYAFESALHVFSTQPRGSEISLAEWNAPELWIDAYKGLANDAVFFAEDIFGGQFCIKRDGIHTFDPETGNSQRLSADFDGWASSVLNNFKVLTGWPLAHEWQRSNGRLARGMRLVPEVPFVMGGKFSVQNLYALASVKAMRMRGSIAVQIKDLPDGGKIRFKIVD